MDSAEIPTDLSLQLPELTDLELTVLVCLIAEQHAIVRAPAQLLDDLEREFTEISSRTFGLTSTVVECSERAGVDEFSGALFGETQSEGLPGEKRSSANLVFAKNLNRASRDVQVMALELIRNNRILTSSGVHTTPKPFVLIALVAEEAAGPPYLTLHLNDAIFISHTLPSNTTTFPLSSNPDYSNSNSHSPTTPSPEETPSYFNSKTAFPGETTTTTQLLEPKISQQLLLSLQKESTLIKSTAEMRRYLHNIPTFLRLHRAVAGGVSAMSTRHLNILVRALAPLHHQTYTTPSLIGLAAHKIYPHRVVLTSAENERSMQWGSDIEAVREALDGLTVERVVQEVLERVDAPL